MKTWKLLWLLLPAAAFAAACPTAKRNARSVALLAPVSASDGPFDPKQARAVLVGVQTFTDRTLDSVAYAVDDAIDLAYVLTIEGKAPLVSPDHVILALAGEPHKRESKQRLKELRAAGAAVRGATQNGIQDALQQQARDVGPNGMLIVAFATHGYSSETVHYVLASDSRAQDPQTAVRTGDVFELATRAPRSLLFVDACRERITARRSAGNRLITAAPEIAKWNAPILGQVVFYAATADQYAYDCDSKKNGCFTAAVIDGLRGKAAMDARGAITVGALRDYLNRHLKQNDPPMGIQVNCDRNTNEMVLAIGTRLGPDPGAVKIAGNVARVFDDAGAEIWHQDLQGEIASAEVNDLDGDNRHEVVVVTRGELVVLDAAGDRLWSHELNAPAQIIIDDLRKTKREIVALSMGSPSRLSIFSHRGKLLSFFPHRGPIQQLLFGRATASHRPKIIAAASSEEFERCAGAVFALHATKGTELWYGCAAQKIRELQTIDHDNDGNSEIRVTTASGEIFYLDFDGRVIAGDVPFRLISRKHRGEAPPPIGAATSAPASLHRRR